MTDLEFIVEIEIRLNNIKRKRDPLVTKYPKNDLRPGFYGFTANVIYCLYLELNSVDDTITRPEWWRRKLNKDIDVYTVQEMVILSKMQYFVLFISRFETLLRQTINIVSPSFDNNGGRKFSEIYTEYLNRLNLGGSLPLLEIFSYIRNTVHTNGIFISRKAQDYTLSWKGKSFNFQHKQPINFMSIENFLFFIDEIYIVTDEILNTAIIKTPDFIEDKFN